MPPWSNPWHAAPPYFQQPNPNIYVPPHPWPRGPGGYWEGAHGWNPDGYGPRDPQSTTARSHKYPNLNPILAADTTLLRFDIKKKPRTEILASTYYANRHSPANANPVMQMRLISKTFPWSIDIMSPTNITCEDVWDALFAALQDPIVDSEWGLIVNSKKQREVVENAMKKRVEGDPTADKRLKRIDYLGEVTMFKGLEKDEDFERVRMVPGSQGAAEVWVVKLSQ